MDHIAVSDPHQKLAIIIQLGGFVKVVFTKMMQKILVLRILKIPDYGTPPVVPNSRVLGRWSNNQYYRGLVTSSHGNKVDIAFDDGDKIQHDPADVGAVILDVNPRPGIIQVDTTFC